MVFDFQDHTAIVTGGTRGIGRSVSEAFLKAGAKVIATYRSNDSAAQQFCEANSQYQARISLKRFDVANGEEVEQFYREIETSHGTFEILVNNSGIRRDAVVGMMKETDWRDVIFGNRTIRVDVTRL